MILLRPRAWGQQKPPLGSQILSGHPLAHGHLDGWLLNDLGGAADIRSLRGQTVTQTNTADRTVSPVGPILVPTNNSTVFSAGVTPRLKPTSGLTLAAFIYVNQTPPAANQTMLHTGILGSTGGYHLGLTTGALPRFIVNSTTSGALSGAVVANSSYLMVGAWNGTQSRLYVNGVLAAGPTAVSAITYGSEIVQLLSSNFTAQQLRAGLVYAHIWDRALTQDEIQWLYVEPYAMIAPPGPRRTWSVPSVGFNPSWARANRVIGTGIYAA
jgi:hypothetical protein